MTCLHEEIKTWYFEDTNQPAGMWSCKSCGHKFFPLKLWVGLTADEIWKCNKAEPGSAVDFHICVAHQNVLDFAEAIEAKLREKNS
jgi:ribosomal protein L37AE/L43A